MQLIPKALKGGGKGKKESMKISLHSSAAKNTEQENKCTELNKDAQPLA